MAWLTPVLLVLACLGLGGLTLRLAGVVADLDLPQRLAWAFGLGFGLLGWLLFPVGIAGFYGTVGTIFVLALSAACGLAWRGMAPVPAGAGAAGADDGVWGGWLTIALVVALAMVMALDLVEGLAPPTEADTLAYHFDLPKRFLAAGHILFVPRAVDGAVPLGPQLTYGAALALGGERAMTLWTMLSGWGAGLLVFATLRPVAGRVWALAGALAWLTAPAVIYGAGGGQVESRTALVAGIALLAAGRAAGPRGLGYALVAGLGAGAFMAAKYTGLVFALALGLVVLAQRAGFRRALVYGLAAGVAGFQWYLWNFLNTGDPVFPMLFGVLPYVSPDIWDADHAEAFRQMIFQEDRVVGSGLWGLITYPAVALFGLNPALEGARVGLGAVPALAVPAAAVIGLWRWRRGGWAAINGPVGRTVAAVVLFYGLYILMGASQRVRHLLPLLPVLLVLCLGAVAGLQAAGARRVLGAGVLAALALGVAMQGLFSLPYVERIARGEDRDAFLGRMVNGYAAVPWINAHLGPDDRILMPARVRNYLVDVPIFYIHHTDEARIDSRPQADNPRRFYDQMRAQGVTHLLASGTVGDGGFVTGYGQWRALAKNGCLELLATIDVASRASRTLSGSGAGVTKAEHIYRLAPPECWARGAPGAN